MPATRHKNANTLDFKAGMVKTNQRMPRRAGTYSGINGIERFVQIPKLQ